MFRKSVIFFISILLVILSFYLNFKIKTTTEISTSEKNIPYLSEKFCIGIINDNNVFYVNFDFNNAKTLIYCYPNNDTMIKDNFLSFSKKFYNFTVTKTAKFNYDFYENTVNRLGGINVLDIYGNESFLLGTEIKNIFKNESDTLYLSYLLGKTIKSIFENKIYDCLYQYSDISYIDIINYEKHILRSLQQIDCIN